MKKTDVLIDVKVEGVEEMNELLKEAINLHEQFIQVIEKITQNSVKLDYEVLPEQQKRGG